MIFLTIIPITAVITLILGIINKRKNLITTGIILMIIYIGIMIFMNYEYIPPSTTTITEIPDLEKEKQAETTPTPEKITEPKTAEEAITNFYTYLNAKEYEKSAQLFGENESDWESVKVYSSAEEKDKALILEEYCNATQTCILKPKILKIEENKNNKKAITLQFLNPDGSLYIFGPCCGATEKEMPPTSTFTVVIKKTNNTFRVLTPPLYRP